MKYIIMSVETSRIPNQKEYPFVFSDDLTHVFMAKGITRALETEFRTTNVKPVAAGFINHFDGKAWGTSESLKLSARPEDEALIQLFFPGIGSKGRINNAR